MKISIETENNILALRCVFCGEIIGYNITSTMEKNIPCLCGDCLKELNYQQKRVYSITKIKPFIKHFFQ